MLVTIGNSPTQAYFPTFLLFTSFFILLFEFFYLLLAIPPNFLFFSFLFLPVFFCFFHFSFFFFYFYLIFLAFFTVLFILFFPFLSLLNSTILFSPLLSFSLLFCSLILFFYFSSWGKFELLAASRYIFYSSATSCVFVPLYIYLYGFWSTRYVTLDSPDRIIKKLKI